MSDYLTACIDSVLMQSFLDYEIILVDDGSSDDGLNICKDYAKINNNIKILHQKNSGVSAARNNGINHSSGDYLLFLDADDFWNDNNFLKDLADVIDKKDFDLIMFPYSYFYGNKIIKTQFNGFFSDDFQNDLLILIQKDVFTASVTNKCIKREFVVNNIPFPKGRVFEEITWCLGLMMMVESYHVYSNPVYTYRKNRLGSTTYKIDLKKIRDFDTALEESREMVEDSPINKEACYTYLSRYYLEMIPYTGFFVRSSEARKILVRHRYLLSYGKRLSNFTKLVSYHACRIFGLYIGAALLSVMQILYSKLKSMR